MRFIASKTRKAENDHQELDAYARWLNICGCVVCDVRTVRRILYIPKMGNGASSVRECRRTSWSRDHREAIQHHWRNGRTTIDPRGPGSGKPSTSYRGKRPGY